MADEITNGGTFEVSKGSLRGKALTVALGAEFALLGEVIAKAAKFGLDHPLFENIYMRAAETGAVTGMVASAVQGGIGALAIHPIRESPFWRRQVEKQQQGLDPDKEANKSNPKKAALHFSTSAFAGPPYNLIRGHALNPDQTIQEDRRDVIRSTAEVGVSATTFIGSLAFVGLENAEPETISNVLGHPVTTAALVVAFVAVNSDMIGQAIKYRRETSEHS